MEFLVPTYTALEFRPRQVREKFFPHRFRKDPNFVRFHAYPNRP
jgi:hypothetical protein